MIKMRLSSSALADRGARLAGVGFTDRLVPRQVGVADYEFPAAQPSQAAAAAAPSGSSPDGAAFSHFTESSPVGARDEGNSAPAVIPPSAGALIHTGNAILLPDHVMVLVRAIAAYERCTNERAATLALLEYTRAIGAGPLARAVADLGDELAEVPAYQRSTESRFRGGGP